MLNNHEEPRVLGVFSSFELVFTSLFLEFFCIAVHMSSEAKRQDGIKTDSLRIELHYHNIVTHELNWSDCDITRLLTAKHVRNNKFDPRLFHAITQLHCFSSTYQFFSLYDQ